MAGEDGTRREEQPARREEQPAKQTTGQAGQATNSTSAWSFYLVRIAIISVTGAFILVMGLFALLGVFNSDNAANITAALGSLFGVVGTLVGAYFGIKASSDAQDRSAATAQQAVQDQKETAAQYGDKLLVVGDKILNAGKTSTQSNPTTAPQKAPGPNPMTLWALAALIPVVAGGTSLVVLRYYTRRMQDAT